MKKNIIKILPVSLVVIGLMANSVLGANIPSGETGTAQTKQEIEKPQNKKELAIYIDNKEFEGYTLIEENNNLLLPVRAFFEKLGYEVGYEAPTKSITLTNGASVVKFKSNEDKYIFSRMAPMPLGQKPVIKDGVSYVPVTLLTEIIQLPNVVIENKSLSVYTKDYNKEQTSEIAEVVSIIELSDDKNIVTVQDDNGNIVMLNLGKVKIEYKTDEKTLRVGQTLKVKYSPVMTASEPPQNSPVSVSVIDIITNGVVISVDKIENNYSILFRDDNGQDIILNIPKDFKIEFTTSDKEIKKGQRLEVILGDAVTLSLPPMTVPKTIKVVNNSPSKIKEEKEKSTATIISVDKNNKTILVDDEKLGKVILNINDDLEVEYKGGVALHAFNWLKEGQKLEVVYSPIMTRSAPPINNPIKIIVIMN